MAAERSPHQTSGTDQHKRLVVGWFSFTCCEDGKEVKSLGEVKEVDDMVRGCPMKVTSFLQTLEKYLYLFNIAQHV
jgi:coenzyme F420-reducing hydrogenase gamma subunit